MKINLLPINQRKARCFFCGTDKSVKYGVSADDNCFTFRVCNVCVVAERKYFDHYIQLTEDHVVQLRKVTNKYRMPETETTGALSSDGESG